MLGFLRRLEKSGFEGVVLCLVIFALLSYSIQPVWQEESFVPVQAADGERVIVLDAGHGGLDGGASGKGGVLEKDLNLAYTRLLSRMLSSLGYQVIETRTSDALVLKEGEDVYGMRKKYDLKNRKDMIHQYEGCTFLSIHMNAFPDGKYKGLQVYYANTSESKALAEQIQNITREHLQEDNQRRPKAADSSIYLLDGITTPAVLVECGFLSNQEDENNLSDEIYQKRLCFLLVCAIMK
ncbi:MAG: N-acetylmuramoyl-L-alanine amidase [Clostridia bacterium]|nr:N-acetylmuramoyl-L-alanine amidase [Clostridia bacterium]